MPHWKITALVCCARRSPKVTLITVFVSCCGVKTSAVTPSFYYVFNISLSCNNNIPSFTGNLWWVLLLGNHLEQFLSRRPQNLKTTGLFYLSIKTNRKPNDKVWFKVQPMGENKINNMMKSIVAATSLELKQRQKVHQPQRSQNGSEQIEESERPAVGDCKGHRTFRTVIRRLRRGKWRRAATAFVCHFSEE